MGNECGEAKRKRGGQPGNRNALKHGFYAKHYWKGEGSDLAANLVIGLEDEIAMLRVATRRLFSMSSQEAELDEVIAITGMLGRVTTNLAVLMKTQKGMGGDNGSDIARQISEALSDVVKELVP